tara:strand:+ start:5638 stop:6273 length:636 start_codon:yes stop_codon:yes gene_type:complete
MNKTVNNKKFEFSKSNLELAKKEISKYPDGRSSSSIISLLWLAQKQNKGWLSEDSIEYISSFLGMEKIRVYEIVTFYSMFNLSPVGKYHFQICGTTPCMLAGAESLKEILEKDIGKTGSVSNDNLFSWVEVECLGACCNAPVIQINDDYFEDLNVTDLKNIIQDLKKNKSIKSGSYSGRMSSEPKNTKNKFLSNAEIEKIVNNRTKPGLES